LPDRGEVQKIASPLFDFFKNFSIPWPDSGAGGVPLFVGNRHEIEPEISRAGICYQHI
jgi:hypothetical protein